jgi:hypothetical protein
MIVFHFFRYIDPDLGHIPSIFHKVCGNVINHPYKLMVSIAIKIVQFLVLHGAASCLGRP